jgi:hypothetical protein
VSPPTPPRPVSVASPATPEAESGDMAFLRSLAPSFLFLFGLAVAACCKKTPPPAMPAPTASAQVSAAAPGEPPKTKEGCDACGGKWGRHGLADVEICICKTKDGGKECRDEADCEAQCVAGEKDFVVEEKGPPPKGHWKGRCAEYATTFGCHRFVPKGASKRPPLPAEDAAEQLCFD